MRLQLQLSWPYLGLFCSPSGLHAFASLCPLRHVFRIQLINERATTPRSKSKANLSKRPKGVNQNPGHAPVNQRAGFWRAQMARKPDSTYFVRAEGLERQLCRQNPTQRHPVWSLCTKKRHPKGCLFECISGRTNYSADLTQENISRILAPVVSIS